MSNLPPAKRHPHYFKDVTGLQHVDVYRLLTLFNVADPCIAHAVKKLLVAGGRGAGKDIGRDVAEAVDTLQRWQEMQAEDRARLEGAAQGSSALRAPLPGAGQG